MNLMSRKFGHFLKLIRFLIMLPIESSDFKLAVQSETERVFHLSPLVSTFFLFKRSDAGLVTESTSNMYKTNFVDMYIFSPKIDHD